MDLTVAEGCPWHPECILEENSNTCRACIEALGEDNEGSSELYATLTEKEIHRKAVNSIDRMDLISEQNRKSIFTATGNVSLNRFNIPVFSPNITISSQTSSGCHPGG